MESVRVPKINLGIPIWKSFSTELCLSWFLRSSQILESVFSSRRVATGGADCLFGALLLVLKPRIFWHCGHRSDSFHLCLTWKLRLVVLKGYGMTVLCAILLPELMGCGFVGVPVPSTGINLLDVVMPGTTQATHRPKEKFTFVDFHFYGLL